MKLIKQALLGSLLLFCLCRATGQNSAIRPLQKGDTLPDLEVNISIGDQTRTTRLSEFKGKLLFLDFWGVYCTSCVIGMIEMLAIQKEFGNKIQIILVTPNSEKEIQKLWNRWKEGPLLDSLRDAATKLMFIKEDSVLNNLFPHVANPTHVWIGGDQIVKNITYSSTTNAENIAKVLNNEPVELDELQYLKVNLDDPLTWLSGDVLSAANIQAYSFIMDHVECSGCWSNRFKTTEDPVSGKILGVWGFNKPIIDLYRFAYGNEMTMTPEIPFNRMIIRTKFKDRILYPMPNNWVKWLKTNAYCYALKVPEQHSGSLYTIMRSDLDRNLNFRSRIEKRKMKCLLLTKISSIDKIRTKGGAQEYDLQIGSLRVRNHKMEQLYLYISGIIENKYPGTLFFDETRFEGNIDIDLPWNERPGNVSFEELRKALRNYGLDLVYGYRNIDMLVIDDPK